MTQHTMLHRWRRCARRKKVVEAENNNLRKIHVCLMEFVANHRINLFRDDDGFSALAL